jgi:hypothetical protein
MRSLRLDHSAGLVMQPSRHRTHHDETRISQALHQMICADTGQEHVGFQRKAVVNLMAALKKSGSGHNGKG